MHLFRIYFPSLYNKFWPPNNICAFSQGQRAAAVREKYNLVLKNKLYNQDIMLFNKHHLLLASRTEFSFSPPAIFCSEQTNCVKNPRPNFPNIHVCVYRPETFEIIWLLCLRKTLSATYWTGVWRAIQHFQLNQMGACTVWAYYSGDKMYVMCTIRWHLCMHKSRGVKYLSNSMHQCTIKCYINASFIHSFIHSKSC